MLTIKEQLLARLRQQLTNLTDHTCYDIDFSPLSLESLRELIRLFEDLPEGWLRARTYAGIHEEIWKKAKSDVSVDICKGCWADMRAELQVEMEEALDEKADALVQKHEAKLRYGKETLYAEMLAALNRWKGDNINGDGDGAGQSAHHVPPLRGDKPNTRQ